MRFRLTELADEDLSGIEDWARVTRGADTADEVSGDIDAKMREIAEHSLRSTVCQFDGEHGLLHEYRSAGTDRFKVFYWVNDAEGFVEIWRVLHVPSDFTRMGWYAGRQPAARGWRIGICTHAARPAGVP